VVQLCFWQSLSEILDAFDQVPMTLFLSTFLSVLVLFGYRILLENIPCIMVENGELQTDNKIKAELLNKFFQSVFTIEDVHPWGIEFFCHRFAFDVSLWNQ
jgi:hypothetical protein